MIHYRLINGDIYSAKIYRSFEQARKDAKKTGSSIVAFANERAALEMSDVHLFLAQMSTEEINNEIINEILKEYKRQYEQKETQTTKRAN